jgi:uncharacterized protein (TIGR03435 family)
MPDRIGLLLLTFVFLAHAQPTPRFEVVSIKPIGPRSGPGVPLPPRMQGGPGTDDPTRLSMRNMPLNRLVMQAYQVGLVQISGPSWLTRIDPLTPDDKYDIDARVPAGATKEQLPEMLQAMLEGRFALKAHRETKEGPVYDLVIAKDGPKLQESPPAPGGEIPPVRVASRGPDGFPITPPGYSGAFVTVSQTSVKIKFIRNSMSEFADWLWGQLKKKVFDRTGLTGAYDFYFEHGRDLPADSANVAGTPSASEPSGPGIREALQSQLGLRLVDARGPIEMLVIDHIDRTPSEN